MGITAILRVVLLVMAATVAGASDGFDRAAAIKRLQEREFAHAAWEQGAWPLSMRMRAGENVDAELQAYKKQRPPSYADLREVALRVVEGDPTDDGAFLAIRIILLTGQWPEYNERSQSFVEGPQAAAVQRLAQLLARHHLQREDVLLPYLPFNHNEHFLMRAYQDSPNRNVRGNAAMRLLELNLNRLNQSGLKSEQRMVLHKAVQGYAGSIREHYADVVPDAVIRVPVSMRVPGKPLNYRGPGTPSLGVLIADRMRMQAHSVGKALPNLRVTTLEGKPDELLNHRGKVLVVDFWATWCKPCTMGHPVLVELKEEWQDRPFEIIGISVDGEIARVREYMRKHPLPWVNWFVGPQGAVLAQWGVQGYPTYLIVDTDGVVQEWTHHLGDHSKALIRDLVLQADRRRM